MKKTLLALCLGLTGLLTLTGCSVDNSTSNSPVIKIGATSDPHANILKVVKPILAEQGIELDIQVIDDYQLLNRALNDGEIDANFFQHVPFLEEQIASGGYDIVEFGKVHIEPLGVYSDKITTLEEIKDGATIAVPNDATNEARALALLHKYGVIKLDDPTNLSATVINIVENPKNITFHEIDAAMLARTLPDVDAAVINTNYALSASLNPLEDALALEESDSPYANILAIRSQDVERSELKALQAAITSDTVREFIETEYQGAVIPVF
ncbi:MAG: MetQ/NlpA family ABC transporter substrate-binding protein [Cellulosilyticaceae bacterium]